MTQPATSSAPSPAATDRWRRRLQLLVPAAALLLALWAHQDALTQPYFVNNDAHQHTFWLQWASNPAAIDGDLLALYAARYEPPAWVALYRALMPLLSPVWIGRLLPLLLFPLAAWLLFAVVDAIDHRPRPVIRQAPWPALLAVALFFISPFFLRKMAGGHPRAFAVPLLLATLYLLQRLDRDRWPRWALSALLVLQSLLYPIAWLLSAATVCGCLLRRENRRLRLAPAAIVLPLLAAMTLGGLLLVARYARPADPRLGSPATRAELAADPQLARQLERGGRTRDLPIASLPAAYETLVRGDLFRVRHAGSTAWPPRLDRRLFALLAALLAGYAYLALRRRLPFPRELLWLTAASAALYLVADLLLLRLLLPVRYIMYSLSLVTVIALALLTGRLLRLAPPLPRRLAISLLAAATLLLAPGIRGFGIDDYSQFAEAYELARQLPEDALIAADPYVADGIPLFTGRHVLANFQMTLPYYPTYYHQIASRLDHLFAALYAQDAEPLRTLRDQHGVDYLIVDRHQLDPATLVPFIEPWAQHTGATLASDPHLYLESLPHTQHLYRSLSARFFAIDLRNL